jgi:hypothetical protein
MNIQMNELHGIDIRYKYKFVIFISNLKNLILVYILNWNGCLSSLLTYYYEFWKFESKS